MSGIEQGGAGSARVTTVYGGEEVPIAGPFSPSPDTARPAELRICPGTEETGAILW